MDLIARAQAEVIKRHDFFVEWFTGRASEADLSASLRAFAPDMVMIEPDANTIGTKEIAAMITGARGNRPAGFEIRVEMIAARQISDDVALVVYDEHQVIDGRKSARRSSAVFSADPEAPEGVVWRQLQETWISA
ncbi:MAG: nuclear transport factor 2 family protein [Hoeflea sp.]|uniref:nuclear transport factor 2 family protein n=1 Tax=Hoeflea sp. TaxID=1940281 RepID=UPI003EF0A2B0